MQNKAEKSNRHYQNYKRGLWAEMIASMFLILRGYRPVMRRYKCKNGEIDLVVKKGRVVIFVEVKYRQDKSKAMESVSASNQKRVRRAAEHFLAYSHWGKRLYMKSGDSMQLRFDVVAISPYLNITHIRNAF